MQTLQIEDITTGRDNRRLYRSIEAAAALSACGFVVRHKKLEIPSRTTDGIVSTWFVDAGIDTAHDLLLRAAIVSGPESLVARSPEHPFLAGLWAIRSLQILTAWLADPATPPAAVKTTAAGRLCCLQRAAGPADLIPLVWAAERPASHVEIREESSLAFCAAAAVCGFLPYPRLTGDDCAHIHLPAASFTFAGLRLEHFHQTAVPGAPATDRHAFSYAVSAALTWIQFQRQADQQRRRTYLLKAKRTEKTALVSDALLDESNGEARKAREEIDEHLALY